MKRKIICIVGPTASGKTSLAVFLAKKLNGEIISADSRQVYKKLDIGTGKEGGAGIKNKELGIKAQNSELEQIKQNARYIDKVPQYMIDVAEPEEKFTLFDWLDGAKLIIEDIFSRGKTPIVIGGTGLYVQALVEGFESCQQPAANSQQKKYKRSELDEESLEELQKIYSQFAIRNSNLDKNNPRRLIRAIELAQEGIIPSKKKPDFEALQIGIGTDREKLYEEIDKRADARFEEGLLREVQQLLISGVSAQWLHDMGLEYRILTNFLIDSRLRGYDKKKDGDDKESGNNNNGDDFEKMKQEMKFAIHHYARRQLTWFGKFPEIKWVNNKQEALGIAKDFLE